MKLETYNFEIRTLIAQFVDAFNDVVIRRYNNHVDRKIQDKIHCNFRYAPKTRTLEDLVNKAKHIKLPVISVSINSMTRNVGRVFNKIEGPYYNLGINDTGFSHPLQPVPIDINVSMSIITRFQSDMDQIVTNFAPYNDPYIVVSWREPYTNHEMRTVIRWSGDISFQYPKDIPPTAPYRIIADTSFTIEGWLYKDPMEPVGKIYKIDTSFTSLSDLNASYEEMLAEERPYNTDVFILSARPQLTLADPFLTVPGRTDFRTVVRGDMFNRVTNVYLSATPGVFPAIPLNTPTSALADLTGTHTWWYDPLSGNPSLSSIYPGFSAIRVPLDDWTANNSSTLSIIFPSAQQAGYIDVIALNEAGYGKLTQDAVRQTLNPYPSSMPQYFTYEEWQHPSISGIQVLQT